MYDCDGCDFCDGCDLCGADFSGAACWGADLRCGSALLPPPSGATSGAGPPAVRPPAPAQAQAPGPCMASSFSATAICWSLVARSARGAYFVPPAACQLDCENCRPP
ncbi:pentapeptide repeat-containing protein [Streptomyces smyrnaeus]|uniref:pentapeptide repeat-containing protein n=1 Tax=Streptomyces smyrnaeus TaxID=1387713 RepID=UPI0036C55E61